MVQGTIPNMKTLLAASVAVAVVAASCALNRSPASESAAAPAVREQAPRGFHEQDSPESITVESPPPPPTGAVVTTPKVPEPRDRVAHVEPVRQDPKPAEKAKKDGKKGTESEEK